MMGFAEKFIAALIVVFAMAAISVTIAATFIAVVCGWAWAVSYLPTWAQYVVNISGVLVIIALVMAIVEDSHDR